MTAHRVGLAIRCVVLAAAGILLAAALSACLGESDDTPDDDRILGLEAKTHSLEESLEALRDENSRLKEEVAALRQAQANFVKPREAEQPAQESDEGDGGIEVGQEKQPAALDEAQALSSARLDDLDARLLKLEKIASRVEAILFARGVPLQQDEKPSALQQADILEKTVELAESSGGEVYRIDSSEPEDRAVLVMPPEPIEGNPLIVSLHGYGGNSADHSLFVPLHEQAVSRGFGLLLPNGTLDGEGNPFWNPTDQCCDSAKTGADDVAYLSGLVARARKHKNFGPVYFFGYSNGGFMAHHMACKGLPGLRAVASLAGTSYVEDSDCEGSLPVSVLHIHGTDDNVILFEGEESEPDPKGEGEPAFYVGAREMVERWAKRAGCDWPENPSPYAALDLDQRVPGAETLAFSPGDGCADGISVELWAGEGSSHTPGYGDAFTNALLDWILAQR